MGQTLTHGIYLPDEGERNCYNGLAANWQLLDGAVGTVAEHTSQIAGKAPAVHTHTKSDITDFPTYGNTAGTICEGNDSRLSDARTPVAHTHTKSDVTDLLNSNLIPSANDSYDLGSSSYQWNNLYAKNYYYNGVAWGLDKANGWRQSQTVIGDNKGWNIINPDLEKGVIPSAAKSSFVWWGDKNNTYLGRICSRVQTDGTTILWLSALNYYKNGALDPTGNSLTTSLILGVDAAAAKFVQANADFRPDVNNVYNLGTSTNKWKSLNGVNPGLLSIPSMGTSAAITVDITDWYIQDPDFPDDPTKKIIDDSVEHIVRSNVSGWIHIAIPNVSGNYAYARQSAAETNMWSNRIADGLASNTHVNIDFIFPIINSLNVRIKAMSALVRIFPCTGNV